jgi:hypothetical protein
VKLDNLNMRSFSTMVVNYLPICFKEYDGENGSVIIVDWANCLYSK